MGDNANQIVEEECSRHGIMQFEEPFGEPETVWSVVSWPLCSPLCKWQWTVILKDIYCPVGWVHVNFHLPAVQLSGYSARESRRSAPRHLHTLELVMKWFQWQSVTPNSISNTEGGYQSRGNWKSQSFDLARTDGDCLHRRRGGKWKAIPVQHGSPSFSLLPKHTDALINYSL